MDHRGWIICIDASEATSLEQVRAFLAGSGEVRFAGQCRTEINAWTERTLMRHQYACVGRREERVLRLYVARMTGRFQKPGSGASSPLSTASTANFQTAVIRVLIEMGPSPPAGLKRHAPGHDRRFVHIRSGVVRRYTRR